jgi:hypothetical protein
MDIYIFAAVPTALLNLDYCVGKNIQRQRPVTPSKNAKKRHKQFFCTFATVEEASVQFHFLLKKNKR